MPTLLDQTAVATVIRDAIAGLEWAPGVKIFADASVRVAPDLDLSHTQLPAARVVIGDEQADPDEPGVRRVQFEVVVLHYDLRDDYGSAAAIGWASGSSGATAGERGVEAIARRVDLEIQRLARDTVPIKFSGVGRGGWLRVDGSLVLSRSLSYEAVCAVEAEP